MVGISIPANWRFNYPLLMGNLKKGPGGHLLRNAAHHLVNDCGSSVFCCDAASPVSVTLSGATGCADPLNGTFAVTYSSTCLYTYLETLTIPASPCSSSACYIQTVSGRSRWWHPYKITIYVRPSAVATSISVEADLEFRPYWLSGASCVPEVILGLAHNNSVFDRSTCLSGSFTRTFDQVQSAAGTPGNPTSCTVAF